MSVGILIPGTRRVDRGNAEMVFHLYIPSSAPFERLTLRVCRNRSRLVNGNQSFQKYGESVMTRFVTFGASNLNRCWHLRSDVGESPPTSTTNVV